MAHVIKDPTRKHVLENIYRVYRSGYTCSPFSLMFSITSINLEKQYQKARSNLPSSSLQRL